MKKEINWEKAASIVTAITLIFVILGLIISSSFSYKAMKGSAKENEILLNTLIDSQYAVLQIYINGETDDPINPILNYYEIQRIIENHGEYSFEVIVVNRGSTDTGAFNIELEEDWAKIDGEHFKNIKAKTFDHTNMRLEEGTKIPEGKQNLTFKIHPCYLCSDRSRIIEVPVCIYKKLSDCI